MGRKQVETAREYDSLEELCPEEARGAIRGCRIDHYCIFLLLVSFSIISHSSSPMVANNLPLILLGYFWGNGCCLKQFSASLFKFEWLMNCFAGEKWPFTN